MSARASKPRRLTSGLQAPERRLGQHHRLLAARLGLLDELLVRAPGGGPEASSFHQAVRPLLDSERHLAGLIPASTEASEVPRVRS
jgi:hypothetical protein